MSCIKLILLDPVYCTTVQFWIHTDSSRAHWTLVFRDHSWHCWGLSVALGPTHPPQILVILLKSNHISLFGMGEFAKNYLTSECSIRTLVFEPHTAVFMAYSSVLRYHL